MNRCSICDYTEENGSPNLGIKPDKRRITWNTLHSEYQCTVCREEIKNSKYLEDEEYEFNNFFEEETPTEDKMVED